MTEKNEIGPATRIRLTPPQAFRRIEEELKERLGASIEQRLLDACYRAHRPAGDPMVASTVELLDKDLCGELGVSPLRLRRARRYLHERGLLVAVPTGKRGSGTCAYVLPREKRKFPG